VSPTAIGGTFAAVEDAAVGASLVAAATSGCWHCPVGASRPKHVPVQRIAAFWPDTRTQPPRQPLAQHVRFCALSLANNASGGRGVMSEARGGNGSEEIAAGPARLGPGLGGTLKPGRRTDGGRGMGGELDLRVQQPPDGGIGLLPISVGQAALLAYSIPSNIARNFTAVGERTWPAFLGRAPSRLQPSGRFCVRWMPQNP